MDNYNPKILLNEGQIRRTDVPPLPQSRRARRLLRIAEPGPGIELQTRGFVLQRSGKKLTTVPVVFDTDQPLKINCERMWTNLGPIFGIVLGIGRLK